MPLQTPKYDRKPPENGPKILPKSIQKRFEIQRYVEKAEMSFRATPPSLLLTFGSRRASKIDQKSMKKRGAKQHHVGERFKSLETSIWDRFWEPRWRPKWRKIDAKLASKKCANKESKAKSNETAKESDRVSRHQGFEVWELSLIHI